MPSVGFPNFSADQSSDCCVGSISARFPPLSRVRSHSSPKRDDREFGEGARAPFSNPRSFPEQRLVIEPNGRAVDRLVATFTSPPHSHRLPLLFIGQRLVKSHYENVANRFKAVFLFDLFSFVARDGKVSWVSCSSYVVSRRGCYKWKRTEKNVELEVHVTVSTFDSSQMFFLSFGTHYTSSLPSGCLPTKAWTVLLALETLTDVKLVNLFGVCVFVVTGQRNRGHNKPLPRLPAVISRYSKYPCCTGQLVQTAGRV